MRKELEKMANNNEKKPNLCPFKLNKNKLEISKKIVLKIIYLKIFGLIKRNLLLSL